VLLHEAIVASHPLVSFAASRSCFSVKRLDHNGTSHEAKGGRFTPAYIRSKGTIATGTGATSIRLSISFDCTYYSAFQATGRRQIAYDQASLRGTIRPLPLPSALMVMIIIIAVIISTSSPPSSLEGHRSVVTWSFRRVGSCHGWRNQGRGRLTPCWGWGWGGACCCCCCCCCCCSCCSPPRQTHRHSAGTRGSLGQGAHPSRPSPAPLDCVRGHRLRENLLHLLGGAPGDRSVIRLEGLERLLDVRLLAGARDDQIFVQELHHTRRSLSQLEVYSTESRATGYTEASHLMCARWWIKSRHTSAMPRFPGTAGGRATVRGWPAGILGVGCGCGCGA
jgi:hypothetical protein